MAAAGLGPRIAMVNDVAGVASLEVELLRDAGLDVDFHPVPRLGAAWRRPLKLLVSPLRLAAYVPIIVRLRRGGYDLVHVHFVSQGFVALIARRPLVLHAHGSDLHRNFQRRVMRAAGHWILRRSQKILYVTPNLAPFLEPWHDRARLLGNPVLVPEHAAPPTSVRRALLFARLERVKGVDAIFKSIQEVADEVELTTIRWGPWAEEYERRYGGIVHFIDPVPHSAVPSLLERFDVVIGQMHQGILSLSELEAMASCRPVLTNLNARLYGDDPPPVVVVRSAHEIAGAIRTLREDPEALRSLTAAARDWVRRHHGTAAHCQALLDVYTEVLGTAWRPGVAHRESGCASEHRRRARGGGRAVSIRGLRPPSRPSGSAGRRLAEQRMAARSPT